MITLLLLSALIGLGHARGLTANDDIPDIQNRVPKLPEDNAFENRNPEFTGSGMKLFEADIVMTNEQREGRQAASNLWTSPVNYAISSTSTADRADIEAALDHWRSVTCIAFNEVSDGDSSPHLKFIKDSGCWSYVGQSTNSGGQDISIGDGCTSLGVVAHEVGHAMGLHHQQSRTDRDTYVIINTANIQDGREGNFDLSTTSNTHGVPYDYTSNMHYGAYYFSSNNQKTIQTIDIRFEEQLGGRSGLTHRDQQIVNIMYGCADSCQAPPTCQNGGFVDKSCACKCPPNTSGTNCETKTGEYYTLSNCGSENMDTEGTITSPNYPNNYPTYTACYWTINAPSGKVVKVTVTDMKLLYRSGSSCPWDYLALRYTGDIYSNDQEACDEELTGQSFTSTGQTFVVKFKTAQYDWYRGFSATVEFIDATTTTAPSTAATTPGTTAPSTAATTPGTAETTTAPGGNCGGARFY